MQKVIIPTKKSYSKKKKIRIWKIFIVLGFFFVIFSFSGKYDCNFDVVIHKGDNFTKILENFSSWQKLKLKIALKLKKFDASKIKVGYYDFTGKCGVDDFIKQVESGPKKKFISFTVLEGRSSFDIDNSLTKKGFISQGEYLNYINSGKIIQKYILKYDFLPKNLKTLEGFLYPDTYFLDANLDYVPQLVDLQLKNFKQKVWLSVSGSLNNFFNSLNQLGINFDFYKVLILASIVEKEEKNPNNQKYVAGVFFNRLQKGMRIDADISLCYGLKIPYSKCTPKVIVQNLSDKNNKYNTRANYGLPPSPIANPSLAAILAVLNYKKTNFVYYLHDKDGNIHLAESAVEHNKNKQIYLNY